MIWSVGYVRDDKMLWNRNDINLAFMSYYKFRSGYHGSSCDTKEEKMRWFVIAKGAGLKWME